METRGKRTQGEVGKENGEIDIAKWRRGYIWQCSKRSKKTWGKKGEGQRGTDVGFWLRYLWFMKWWYQLQLLQLKKNNTFLYALYISNSDIFAPEGMISPLTSHTLLPLWSSVIQRSQLSTSQARPWAWDGQNLGSEKSRWGNCQKVTKKKAAKVRGERWDDEGGQEMEKSQRQFGERSAETESKCEKEDEKQKKRGGKVCSAPSVGGTGLWCQTSAWQTYDQTICFFISTVLHTACHNSSDFPWTCPAVHMLQSSRKNNACSTSSFQ